MCERPGYHLRGFFTVGRNFLADIGEGVCCKPESHPDQDGPHSDINVNFTTDGMKQCPNGMFLKGLYKTTCSTIDCLTKIRCSELIPGWLVMHFWSSVLSFSVIFHSYYLFLTLTVTSIEFLLTISHIELTRIIEMVTN